MKFLASAVLFGATLVAGRVIERQAATNSTPLPPSQDPWYTAPDGYADYPPGTVFKVREANYGITNSSGAYNYLYRTTDSQYNASWAVATLLIPEGANSTENLLSYGLPYDSAAIDASPSYALYTGGGAFGTGEISEILGLGYYIVTADYEGPLASFTAGVQSGHATLDSIRAVFACPEFGFDYTNTKKAIWGYSGGALSSEWALELQNQYAPELRFLGGALGGLTPNVTSVLFTINGTVYAGLAPSGILGLSSQYPEAYAYLQSQLIPSTAAAFNAARNYTLAQTIGAFAGQDIGAYFYNGLAAIESPIAQYVINHDGVMGYHGVPNFPLFVYKAIGDDISPIADTDTLIDRYCGVGATIEYQRNTVGNHASELINGRPRAVAFLKTLFEGTYSATGCQITNVTVTA